MSVFSVKLFWETNGYLTSEFHGTFTFPGSEMHSLFCNLMVSDILQMPYGSRIIALKAPEMIEQMLNIYLLKSKSNSQNEITLQPYCLCLFVDTCLFFSYYRNDDINHWLIHLLNSN